MFLLHEVHEVVGAREDEFEALYREGWVEGLAAGNEARLLYYLHHAHGTGVSYNVVTLTALRDGAAWLPQTGLMAVPLDRRPDGRATEDRRVAGGLLVQGRDLAGFEPGTACVVTQAQPTGEQTADLGLAWLCCKHARSDAVALAGRNAHAVGVGPKIVKGKPTSQLCVRIYVVHKLPLSYVAPVFRFPKELAGLPTDSLFATEATALSLWRIN